MAICSNVRGLVVKEGEFGKSWIPAVTLAGQFKFNVDEPSVNRELHGTLSAIGVTKHEGLDFTLYSSKTITCLPRPIIVSAGVRASAPSPLLALLLLHIDLVSNWKKPWNPPHHV